MSIVSLLVALGIVGVLSVVMMTYFNNSMSVATKIARNNELEDLRRLIRVGTNCTLTNSSRPTQCSEGTKIELKTGKTVAKALVGTGTTMIGKYEIRASCTAIKHEIKVEVRRGYKDPWFGLFPADLPLTCSAN